MAFRLNKLGKECLMFLNNFIYISLMSLFVAACGGASSEIEDAIRDRLKDPGSAQFNGIVIGPAGKNYQYACAMWNAKNGFGGYGDPKIAELVKKGSTGWEIVSMDGNKRNCTDEFFGDREIFHRTHPGQ